MIITEEKIRVTESMMDAAGMTRFGKLGIPKDPKDPSKGLVWKEIFDLDESDFDAIEEYFIMKNGTKKIRKHDLHD